MVYPGTMHSSRRDQQGAATFNEAKQDTGYLVLLYGRAPNLGWLAGKQYFASKPRPQPSQYNGEDDLKSILRGCVVHS
jgi:hypothetical protein